MAPTSVALDHTPVLLDGGLATHLEARGNSVASALWSADLLQKRPDEVRAAHRDFFEAGARVATTCSYQVTYEGFQAIGLDRDAVDDLLRLSVQLGQLAREDVGLSPDEAWVAASIGPYGASPGRGTEYDGDYGLSASALRTWHRPRIEVLTDAEPDLLLAETIPSLGEVEALAGLLSEAPVPALLSVTVADGALRSGESLKSMAKLLDGVPNIIGIGVNCSAITDATEALVILHDMTDLPLVAYPNSGEQWDAASRTWHGTAGSFDNYVTAWRDMGARWIGGCCRVGTDEIRRIAQALSAEYLSHTAGR